MASFGLARPTFNDASGYPPLIKPPRKACSREFNESEPVQDFVDDQFGTHSVLRSSDGIFDEILPKFRPESDESVSSKPSIILIAFRLSPTR